MSDRATTNMLEQQHYQKLIEQEVNHLPFYVKEYLLVSQHTVMTNYQYLAEFRRFFDWLRDSGISKAENDQKIELQTLANLKPVDLACYVDYLKNHPNAQGKQNSITTINRSLNALSSLFHYLTVVSEKANGMPYFEHNVMQKVSKLKGGETLNARARKLENKMFCGAKKHELIDFIDHDYEKRLLRPQDVVRFNQNKTRDIALIATLLGTAGRRSEIANLNMQDLHLAVRGTTQNTVSFLRKGGTHDIVPIAHWAVPYLQAYLGQRKTQYYADEQTKAVFLTCCKKQPKRISATQINNIVKKYTTAFGRPSTAHKMRHTTASELFQDCKNEVLVSQQLGQKGTSATALYTHVTQDELQRIINHIK